MHQRIQRQRYRVPVKISKKIYINVVRCTLYRPAAVGQLTAHRLHLDIENSS